MQIAIRTAGTEIAINRLDRLSLLQLSELADELADASNEWLDDHFQGGYGPFGAWPGLSPATLSINPRRAGGQVLQDTGALKNSSRYDATGYVVTGTTGVFYGRYHQNGPRQLNMFGRGIKATLPRRAFLGWTDGEIDEIGDICRNFIRSRVD